MMKNKIVWIIAGLAAVAFIAVAILFWFWQKGRQPQASGDEAAQVIQAAIQEFDDSNPQSFTHIQKIVELGGRGTEALLDRSDSHLIKDQWTAAVGLNTIARGLEHPDCIMNQMKALTFSSFETIRMYAAASLAENGDFSKKQILLDGLKSNEMMMFMRPPKSISEFANLTLEITTGQSIGYSASNKAEAAAKWSNYFNTLTPDL